MPAFTITDKCDGCDACRTACPAGAISGEQYHKHKINPDLCYNCGLCGELCENSAILDGFGCSVKMRSREEWKTPIVDRALCVGCSVCIEDCAHFALELSEPGFHGNTHVYAELTHPELCIGCGKCAKRCPVGAIALGRAVIEETVIPVNYNAEEEVIQEHDHASLLESIHGTLTGLFDEKKG